MTRRRKLPVPHELRHIAAKQSQNELAAHATLASLVLDKHNLNDAGSKLGLMVAIREAVRNVDRQEDGEA